MNNDLQAKISELKTGYLNKLKDVLLAFKLLNETEEILIQEVYSKVHSISGTSGMYGIKDLSDVSTEFEFYLKPIKDNPESINQAELKVKLSNYIKFLETFLIGE